MKTRKEYEEILNRTFVQSGTEGLERTNLEVLLDIRDILIWLRDDILLQRAIREREFVAVDRVRSYESGPETES